MSRSNYYYGINRITTEIETDEDKLVIEIFEASKGHYGARKIRQIMMRNALVSSYTVSQYKPVKSTPNEQKIENIVDRDFDHREIH
ncbi:hypothetical protein P5915_09810, partial [Acholeplasma manati]|nr:hypothetical protein [Paracholeplasma manati]